MAINSAKRIAELESQAQLVNGVRYLRYVFYFYSFISFAFWFLNCFEVDLYWANWLFIGPYRAVRSFYNVDGVSIDFSLAIIGIISLIIGGIIDFVCNRMYDNFLDAADEEERKMEQRKLKRRNAMPKPVEAHAQINNASINPFEDSKLLFLVQPHINKIKKKENDIELTFQEVEVWRKRVNAKVLEGVSYSKPMQRGYYRKNLFLLYKDFYYVEDFVYYIKPTMESIINEFKRYGILVKFNYVLSSITSIDNLEKELDCMDTILSLDFTNEYIVTNRFKATYDNKPVRKYNLQMKGEYNLSKNLSVTNRQPLYSLEDAPVRGEEL